MNRNSKKDTRVIKTPDLVLMSLFIALTYIGTSIRITIPAIAGHPFLHLGNSFLLLAVLFIGYPKGALAGGLGFFLFDILNGYPLEAPYFLIESFVVGGAAILAFRLLIKNDSPSFKIFWVVCFASLFKGVMSYGKGVVMAMFIGNDLQRALFISLSDMQATLINIVGTILIVSIAYYPLNKIVSFFYRRMTDRY